MKTVTNHPATIDSLENPTVENQTETERERLSQLSNPHERYIVSRILNLEKSGARMGVKLRTVTEPKLLKKSRKTKNPCPYHCVRRKSVRMVMLNTIYGRAVERKLEKITGEPQEFTPESLWGGNGEHWTNTIVRHAKTGKLYVAYRPHESKTGEQVKMLDEWEADTETGTRTLTEDEIKSLKEEYLQKQSESRYDVTWRVVALENILDIE